MRVVFGVTVFVMFQMQLSIGFGMEEGRSLSDESKEIKKAFPKGVHDEHAMRHVAMKEETLGKDTGVPVDDEKNDDDQHGWTLSKVFSATVIWTLLKMPMF